MPFHFFLGKMSLPQTIYFSISDFWYKLTQPNVQSDWSICCLKSQPNNIYLTENGHHSSAVLKKVDSPNLSPPALQYTALSCSILHFLFVCITAHRAGGKRLGDSTFFKTTGEWCRFSVGYTVYSLVTAEARFLVRQTATLQNRYKKILIESEEFVNVHCIVWSVGV